MSEYYANLTGIENICSELCQRGRYQFPIIIYHELLRYLYPIEPYSKFRHSEPKKFLEDYSEKLLNFSKNCINLDLYDISTKLPNYSEFKIEEKTTNLYSSQWERFTKNEFKNEALQLLEKRIPKDIIEKHIRGKNVIDLGCGSGRYSLALKLVGAKSVLGIDYSKKSFSKMQEFCKSNSFDVSFLEGDIPNLELENLIGKYDFIFSNGVLHHTLDWKKSLSNYCKLINKSGYLYLYASGGYFWKTRESARRVSKLIPRNFAQQSLDYIGIPNNRFIFMDIFYVPIEEHLKKSEILPLLDKENLNYQQLITKNDFDPLSEFAISLPDSEEVWGEMEHRYLITR